MPITPHQVPLGGAAEGGVAGQVGAAVQADGEQGRAGPQAGGGHGCLDARVPGAHYRHVVICQMVAPGGGGAGRAGCRVFGMLGMQWGPSFPCAGGAE